jgi:RimJ/RimL family protein N-acetyltransferase
MLALLRPDVSLPPAIAGTAFLRDGTEVWIRPVQEQDRALVREFLRREPEESLALRYFAAVRADRAEAEIVAPTSPDERLCLVALGNRAGEVAVLGVGEYARTRPATAEIAFLVGEPYRGLGIATLLLARLARAARAFGILSFEARVVEDNPGMLEVFRGSGLPFTERGAEGEVDVLIPLVPEVGRTDGPENPAGPVPSRRSPDRNRRARADRRPRRRTRGPAQPA